MASIIYLETWSNKLLTLHQCQEAEISLSQHFYINLNYKNLFLKLQNENCFMLLLYPVTAKRDIRHAGYWACWVN